MKKNIFITCILILSIITYFFIKIKTQKKYTIAVIQCASNKSLDLLAFSFIKKISTLLGENNIEILYKNTEGSLMSAHSISQQLYVNKNIDLFFSIGGATAQALAKVEDKRPIIISGIADPYAYKLDQNNICGTIDAMNEDTIIQMIVSSMPEIKRIGILRTASDINENEFIYFKKLCQERGLLVLDFPVYNESEILPLSEKACCEIDALLIPCDSLVVSALPYIIKICKKYTIPVFTCFNEGISLGAFCSTGADYEENGIECAYIAEHIILKNKKPIEIKFKKVSYDKIYCNKKTKLQLNIKHVNNNKNIIYI